MTLKRPMEIEPAPAPGLTEVELLLQLINRMTGLQQIMVDSKDVLEAIRDATIQKPRLQDGFLVRRVQVVTAGTPVPGPDVEVPTGWVTIVRMRRHTGSPNGYIAGNNSDVVQTGMRMELKDNDSITVVVSNWKKLWFDADTDTTNFELAVER